MAVPAQWMRSQLDRHNMTQAAASVHAGMGQATISDILNKGRIPTAGVLFRLADCFVTSHREILQIPGILPYDDELPGAETAGSDEHPLTWQLVEEFRKVPDEWKHEAVGQMRMFLRLAKTPPGSESRYV